jgi:hypothetical protein
MENQDDIVVKANGRTFEPIAPGLYLAVCYGIFDVGTQTHTFEGAATEKHDVVVSWEFPKVRIDIEVAGEKKNMPRALSKVYTLSLSDRANLRKDIEKWRGKALTETEAKGFNISKLLGQGCQILVQNTEKNGKVYSNIGAITALPKGTKAPKTENPCISFSLAGRNLHEPLPEGLPDWIKKKVYASREYQALKAPLAAQEATDDVPAWDADEEIDPPF